MGTIKRIKLEGKFASNIETLYYYILNILQNFLYLIYFHRQYSNKIIKLEQIILFHY